VAVASIGEGVTAIAAAYVWEGLLLQQQLGIKLRGLILHTRSCRTSRAVDKHIHATIVGREYS
jgi:hypothetical protein